MNKVGILEWVVSNRYRVTLGLISLGFGLLFIFFTPPWWHHDEPGHFQVAWFAANLDRFPAENEIDPLMRLKLARSLDEHGFYDYRNYKIESADPEPWVMQPQANDPKLSYWVYSIPLRLNHSIDYADQLIILRLVSLMFFVALTLLVHRFALELFPTRPMIAFFAGFFFALLPGGVNQMTAVSNEPLGALLFTAFLLFSRRTVVRQPLIKSVIPQLAFGILSIYTITTIWIIVPLAFLLSIAFRFSSTRWLKISAVAIACLLALSPFLVFENNEARFWYSSESSPSPSRVQSSIDPNGEYALEIPPQNGIKQRVPKELSQTLSGQPASLGFYAWASQDRTIQLQNFLIVKYAQSVDGKINLTTRPTWFSIPLTMSDDIGIIKVMFTKPIILNVESDYSLYISSVTLSKGSFPSKPPAFADASLSNGTWDGKYFENLIRNANLQEVWPRFAPVFDKLVIKILPVHFDQSFIATIFDAKSSWWYFARTYESLNKTYWGKLGASNFDLTGGEWVYPFFSILFATTAFTGGYGLWLGRKKTNWRLAILLLTVLVVSWGQTLLRGVSTLEFDQIVIPWSRYSSTTFPLISILIAASAVKIFEISKHSSISQFIGSVMIFALPLSLAAFAILSLLSIFYLPQDVQKYVVPAQWIILTSLLLIFALPPINKAIRRLMA